MKQVFLLFVTTYIGVAYCHDGPHAGNFMASCPCFSFQGQNILWPSGPQGFAGMSTPWNCFNHPFFAGKAGGKPCGILGAPHEASSPVAHDDSTVQNPVVTPTNPISAATSKPDVVHPAPVVEAPVSVAVPEHTAEQVVTPVPQVDAANPVDTPVQPVPVVTPTQPEEASAPVLTAGSSVETPATVGTPVQPVETAATTATVAAPVLPVESSTAPVATPAHIEEASAPVQPVDLKPLDSTVSSTSAPAPIVDPKVVVDPIPAVVTPVEEASASSQPDAATKDAGTKDKKDDCPKECKSDACIVVPPLIDACNITSQNISALGEHLNCIPPLNPFGFPQAICDVNLLAPHDLDICAHRIPPPPCFYNPPGFIHNNHIHDFHPFFPCYGGLGCGAKILPHDSTVNDTDLHHFNLTDIHPCFPSDLNIIHDGLHHDCIHHEDIIKSSDHDCITHLPKEKNKSTQKEEASKNVPTATVEDHRVCHIPVLSHHSHNVIEDFTDHIPITNARIVPLVQSCMNQIPVTRSFIRPLVEGTVTNVPIVDPNVRPIVPGCVNPLPGTPYGGIPCNIENTQHYQPLEPYAEPSNVIPSWNNNPAPCEQVRPAFGPNVEPNFEAPIRAAEPECDPNLNEFRRNLYLPSPEIARGFEGFHGEPSPNFVPQAGPEQFDGPLNYQDLAEREPVNDGGDLYVPGRIPNEEPFSAPLANQIPFPNENAEEVKDQSSGNHPDYCD